MCFPLSSRMSFHAPSTNRRRSSGSSTSRARALSTPAVASPLVKMDNRLRAMDATLTCKNARSPDHLCLSGNATSLNGGCGVGLKRRANAAEGVEEEEKASCCAELVPAAVEVTVGADLIVADVVMVRLVAAAASPRCLLVSSARDRCSASRARAVPCLAESAAAWASTATVLRLFSSSSAVARASSATVMSTWWRAETCASISVMLLVVRGQFAAGAALKGVGRDAHVAWGAWSGRGTGLDKTCCCLGFHCCCLSCCCHSRACSSSSCRICCYTWYYTDPA